MALNDESAPMRSSIAYLNRLSDYLFVAARFANRRAGAADPRQRRDVQPRHLRRLRMRPAVRQPLYNEFKLAQGTPAVATPKIAVGPFSNVQPYLYWSCQTASGSQILFGMNMPAPNFAWSFSWGTGFQGTDLQKNDLYVMVSGAAVAAPAPGGAVLNVGSARLGSAAVTRG